MTGAAEKFPTPEDSSRPRPGLQDAAFLLLSLSILILPAWLQSGSQGGVEVLNQATSPVTIDVNHAPWHEWTLLEGIGEVRARQVVDFRKIHGPFRSAEELKSVPRMPRGWVEKALPHLKFEE